MTSYRSSPGFFEIPHAAVYLLLTANIAVYGLCLQQSDAGVMSSELLFRNGAMYSGAIDRHQYWRLIAYGFLHVNLIHLVSNMFCLVLWGAHLEKRVGSLYFLIIYASAVIFGGVVGTFTHAGPYLTVGASAGTSGILGALLCLWILGRIDLLASFFVINIGLNIVIALSYSGIDWGAHFGGFAAGFIGCAVLDLIEKANSLVLRCKFPEFIKVNVFVVACAFYLVLWGNRPAALAFNAEAVPSILAYAATCFLVIKLIDVALSVNKGLAIIVVVLATVNAAVVLFGGRALGSSLSLGCALRRPGEMVQLEQLVSATCSDLGLTIDIVAVCAFALTILLYSHELYRGIKDVGFISATLRAERKRRQGI
jgi:membrane associated rhomboid family serine protease